MTQSILGIDIAKKTFRVALLRQGKIRQKGFDNNSAGFADLSAWLAKLGEAKVRACMEATNTYGEALATFLHHAGHPVSVVNPARVKAFGASELARNKTDHADAALIARFCLAHSPELWSPPPLEYRELQGLVRRLDALQEMRQQETNRLEGASATVAASITEVLRHLDEEISRVLRQINDHIDRHPDLKRQHELLMSIPGIGEMTSARFLGEAGDVKRYRNARQLAAYVGTTPSQRQSGQWQGRTVMSKTGNSRLRKYLFFPAIVAKTHNPVMKSFCDRLLEKGKAPKAVVGAAMRKLVHLAYGVLKSGVPFNPEMAAGRA